MITIKQSGNLNNTNKFLKRVSIANYLQIFEKYGREGVATLASVTPLDSGETSESWDYKIKRTSKGITIAWTNSNVVDGVPIVILLQYGHGTGNGGYVQGIDFINPAIKPIFEKISNELWKEVMQL